MCIVGAGAKGFRAFGSPGVLSERIIENKEWDAEIFFGDNICLPTVRPVSQILLTRKTRWNDQNAELHKVETARCSAL